MKTTALIAAAALAAVPAAAAAHPGNGQGQGQGKGLAQREAHAPDAAKGKGRCARPQRVAFVARGTFVSFADDALVMKVVRANHHARSYTSETPLSTKGAKVTFRGLTGFDQAVSTDRVMVIGKLVRPRRGCTGDTSVVLRKVMVTRTPPADQTPDSQQAPEQD
jgi:hypothetical protein